MKLCKTNVNILIATAILLLFTGYAMGTTITAQDIIDQAGITNDFGVQSIMIGDFTIETIQSVNLAGGTNTVNGAVSIGTAAENYSTFEGTSGLKVSFDAPVHITNFSFGLHGPSDGSLQISGFASNPSASTTSGTASFSGDTLTIAQSGFSQSYDITLTNQVDVSSLTFTTSTTVNDGVGFLGITYGVAPPSAPTAVNDTVSTPPATATNIFVLINDIGAGLGIESIESTATNASGQVKGNVAYTPGNDFVTCTPSNGFFGDLFFSYVVTNSFGSDTGLVTVAVEMSATPTVTWQGGIGNFNDANWEIDGAADQSHPGNVGRMVTTIVNSGRVNSFNNGSYRDIGTGDTLTITGGATISGDFLRTETVGSINAIMLESGNIIMSNANSFRTGGSFVGYINFTGDAGSSTVTQTDNSTASSTLADKISAFNGTTSYFAMDGTMVASSGVGYDGTNLEAVNAALATNVVNGRWFQLVEASGVQTLILTGPPQGTVIIIK